MQFIHINTNICLTDELKEIFYSIISDDNSSLFIKLSNLEKQVFEDFKKCFASTDHINNSFAIK